MVSQNIAMQAESSRFLSMFGGCQVSKLVYITFRPPAGLAKQTMEAAAL